MVRDKKRGLVYLFIFIFAISIFVLPSKSAWAVPAKEEFMKLYQPSGEEFYGSLYGDEWFNCVISKDGYILKKDDAEYWCYCYLENGNVKISKNRYALEEKPAGALDKSYVDTLRILKKNEPTMMPQSIARLTAPQRVLSNFTRNILVIMTEFQDRKFTYDENQWSNLFFSAEGKSVYNYYREVSMNKLNFRPASENYGTANDGVVKIALNRNHPDFKGDFNKTYGSQELARDAIKASDQYVDYSRYDLNHDGYLTNDELHIIIVVAGYEESASFDKTPSVWAHRWNLSKYYLNLDGISGIGGFGSGYTIQGEVHEDHRATVGVFCHELGHDLGLPDLYDTDNSSQGIGVHSLMASGSWTSIGNESMGATPSHLDAWSKVELGFVDPVIANRQGIFNVNNFSTGTHTIIKIPTVNPNEYFLVENRQLKGYDAGLSNRLASGGIAIWHIDSDVIRQRNLANTVNSNEYHKGVDLEEANEGVLGRSQLDYDLWGIYNHYFRNNSVNVFSDNTVPSSKLYDGQNSNISININSNSGDIMEVRINPGSAYNSEDVNGDGVIDTKDLDLISSYYNITSEDSKFNPIYDLNNDGIIDIYDIVKVANKIK